MPIELSHPVRVLDQVAFHLVDELVTGLSFAIHNKFGRYLDERLYQAELERRMREEKIENVSEMRLTALFDSFAKDYFVDFLVDGGIPVETKAVEVLSPAHRAQLLNYLFHSGLKHGTLLNFRSDRVQREFVSGVVTRIPVYSGAVELGSQSVHLVEPVSLSPLQPPFIGPNKQRNTIAASCATPDSGRSSGSI